MSLHNGRYTAAKSLSLAEGWSLERLTPPSRLYGANGLRTGPDGRIYVAQVVGSQISALDVATVGKWRDIARDTAWKDYVGKSAISANLLKLATDVSA